MKKTWIRLSLSLRSQVFVYMVMVLLGVLFLFGDELFKRKDLAMQFMGLGAAFVAAGILAFIQRVFFFDDLKHQIQELIERPLERALTACLFTQIRSGITAVHSNRRVAIHEFAKHVKAERKRIIVIGRTFRGLLDTSEKQQWRKEFADALRGAVRRGVSVEILLMHPALEKIRGGSDDERNRFLEVYTYLTGSIGVPKNNIHLSRIPPSLFCIILTDRMLITPYPSHGSASDQACFELKVTMHESNVFSQILTGHYESFVSEGNATKPVDQIDLNAIERRPLDSLFAHVFASKSEERAARPHFSNKGQEADKVGEQRIADVDAAKLR